ncbi:MAG: hypothetical protein ACPGNV_14655 [Mangrovicoccus sp.]
MKKLALLIASLPTLALAHPGHGAEPTTHWLTAPDHLIVLGLAVAALLVRPVWRRIKGKANV